MSSSESQLPKIDIVFLAIILAVGIFLRLPPELFTATGPLHPIARLHPQPAFNSIGFDENLYREYVDGLTKGGLGAYPQIVDEYIEHQKTLTGSILPPVRFLYIFTASVWRSVFGCDALTALHQVAAFFSMLTLCLAAVFAWRLRGSLWMLATTALVAVAPTQIHMSQHALVDGFFAFWALLTLWLLWENLRAPRDWRWLAAYVLSLSLLVLTKENSAFVWFGCVVLIVTNRWLQFGIVTREVLIATILGPLLGVVVLIFLAGGIPTLFETYHLSITKNFTLSYAIRTGDGPWQRYLVDLLLVSPIILVLALGCLFRLDRTQKPEWFLSIFIAASYLVMCNLKYGMNLRYANMWDMPLRFLAVSFLVPLVRPFGKYRDLILGIAIASICAIELRDYVVLAVQYPLYELVPEGLLRALHILKGP
jgi:4-amino-4-deoxy-L-arabinose transferase-like glycosyltransferase